MFFALLGVSPLFGLSFTGNVGTDFLTEACFDDPGGGVSIGVPAALPAGTISGFDIDQICLLLDQQTDTLYVGLKTFNHVTTGLPIPFGDADGDGEPGGTSAALAGVGGLDFPDLATAEFFALILDFDADLATDPEVVAGVSAQRQAPEGFRVSEVAFPHLGLDYSFLSSYYGPIVTLSQASALFASPSAAAPHLEFAITNASLLPGFNLLKTSDPDETLGIVFKAGSLADAGIGEEEIEFFPKIQDFFDGDGDGLPNSADLDQDNDGIPDAEEEAQETSGDDAGEGGSDAGSDGGSGGGEEPISGSDEGSDPGEEPEGTPAGTPGGGPMIQIQGSGCSLIPSREDWT